MNMMGKTLSFLKDASFGQNSEKLVNRMTSVKSLSSFSRDPLDWLRFKEAFDYSSASGDFSNCDECNTIIRYSKRRSAERS